MSSYRFKPCTECPWRTDVDTGRFPPERFAELAGTAYDMAMHQFACHKTPEGHEKGCAGFVLRGSDHNLGARLACRDGRLDRGKVSSPYPLYGDFRAMAIANGLAPDHPALLACRSPDPDV